MAWTRIRPDGTVGTASACEGKATKNGFYGNGPVNAAVTGHH
jgi:hypothetical protein